VENLEETNGAGQGKSLYCHIIRNRQQVSGVFPLVNGIAKKESFYDDEIVALLHSVGQRLITSEQDRKELKRAMDDLMEKADQGERAYLTIQDRISKTESAFEKRQKALENALKEQEERVEKAVVMANKLEEAIAAHNKINRRLDKVAQEKAQMIRKLERIEEAVIETHEALNAKAQALLSATKQDIPAKAWLPQAPVANDTEEEARPWWQNHGPMRAAAITAMVMLGVGGGWAVTSMQDYSGKFPAILEGLNKPQQVAVTTDTAAPPSETALAAYQETPDPGQQEFVANIEQSLASEQPAAGETAAATEEIPEPFAALKPAPEEEAASPAEETNVMDMTDEQLLASLNNDPDALAAKLNEIETGNAAVQPEELDEAAPAPALDTKDAAFSPAQQDIKEVTTEQFLSGQRDQRTLAARIPPDPSLPGVIKEVEKKAYEGIAEAQHDLAAIYTAGHGGVEINYEKAAAWFKESALQGVANARYNLGVLYHQGLGVERDINTAVSWYRAAAEMGHPEAQYNLGIAYIEGVGTRYDPKQAAVYFEKSAKQGILEAAYNLGLIYENGLTGPARPDEALYWYKHAAELGSPEAKAAMDQLAKTMGMMPNEIDQLYGRKKQERADAAPAPAAPAPLTPAAATQRVETSTPAAAQGGVDYIEAQPLTPETDASAAPALSVGEALDESSAAAYQEDQTVTAQIQEQLIRLGLYPGPADGVNDNLTTDAIRAYQANYNLKADGAPSQALLVHMMTSELGNNDEYGSRE